MGSSGRPDGRQAMRDGDLFGSLHGSELYVRTGAKQHFLPR